MMEADELLKIVLELNDKRGVDFVPNSADVASFRGNVLVGKESFDLCISFPPNYPQRFPEVYLLNNERFRPHIGNDGKICLFDDSSLLIRTDHHEQMLIDAFDRAIEILSIVPGSNDYNEEVARELNAYWAGMKVSMLITNLGEYTQHEYKPLTTILAGNRLLVSDSVDESEVLLHNHFGIDLNQKIEIDTTLLRFRSPVVPPIQKIYTWKWFRRFIQRNISSSQRKQFSKFLNSRKTVLSHIFVISIPSAGRDISVGFWVHYKGQQSKVVEKNVNYKVEPIMIRPIDIEYLLKRSGTDTGLKEKAVLLLGCGSIGGYIAENIAQAGVTALDILDKDILTEDNIHRHILGFDDALKGKFKSDLMKYYLETKYPYVDVDSMAFKDRSVESFLCSPERLSGYDIIISALGEPTLNLELNRILSENSIKTPFVVCFNEPYGIGGHAIAVNIKNDSCLRCLYTDLISEDLVPFRASFVQPNQDFKKSLSGCAGAFVEYSALDSQQTALLCVRLAIDVLTGKCTDNKIVSWWSDSERLNANGYVASEFYNRMTAASERGVRSTCVPHEKGCPVCKKKKQAIQLKI